MILFDLFLTNIFINSLLKTLIPDDLKELYAEFKES